MKMKKLLTIMLAMIVVLSLSVMTVSAAGDVEVTANALKDYPDNYTEIYGVSFNVTQSGGFYMAGIYIDNGSKTDILGGSSATFASSTMVDYGGSFGAAVTAKDLVDDESADLVYLSSKPLFSDGASMANARLYAPSASPVAVNGYKWLDKDGKKFVPTAKPDESKTDGNKTDENKTDGSKTDENKTSGNTTDTDNAAPPKTGDASNTVVLMMLAALSLGGIMLMTIKSRKAKSSR